MHRSVALSFLAAAAAVLAQNGVVKANFNNVLKLNAYADNWCMIYINGKLAAVDQIEFLPHNVVTVSVLPIYPMTIAVLARDNADPKTGMEYGTQIGDAGFILKFSDGTVTNANWKVKTFFKGPLDRDTKNPRVQYTPIPANWYAPDFDDSDWVNAAEYPASRVGPDGDYPNYDFGGAKFIWSDDIDLDNTVIFRYKAEAPRGYRKTWNADGDFEIRNIVNEARLAPVSGPQLFAANAQSLAVGYVTRSRSGAEDAVEVLNDGVDLGSDGDVVRLSIHGSVPEDGVQLSATIGGMDVADVTASAAPQAPGSSLYEFVLPRALAGAGLVDVVIQANGKGSNPVTVRIL